MNLKEAYSHVLSVTQTSNPEATTLATALVLRDLIECDDTLSLYAEETLEDTWEQNK